MTKKTFDVREAETHLREILSIVSAGAEVILKEGDKPIARLIPIKDSSTERIAGLHRGVAWMSDDFVEPLPEDFWIGT